MCTMWLFFAIFYNIFDLTFCNKHCAGSLCIPEDYDKSEMPKEKVQVLIDMDIVEILDVNDLEYTATFFMYFGVRWNDSRLINNATSTVLNLDVNFLKNLWVPDVFIYNYRSFETSSVINKFARLTSQNQGLTYNVATMVSIYCPMRFEKYPLDQQSCPLQIGSYGYNDSYMSYKLGRLTRDTQQRIAVLDYRIDIFNLSSEYQLMKGLEDPNSNFTLTGFMMELNRKRFSYVVNFYLPSGLFVVVSWVSFLIPPEVIPGRMTFLVTLFLVLINIYNFVQNQSPVSDTINLLSFWMIVCILFVFGALGVYATILLLRYKTEVDEKRLNVIDTIFLFCFPTLFSIFNAIYWSFV